VTFFLIGARGRAPCYFVLFLHFPAANGQNVILSLYPTKHRRRTRAVQSILAQNKIPNGAKRTENCSGRDAKLNRYDARLNLHAVVHLDQCFLAYHYKRALTSSHTVSNCHLFIKVVFFIPTIRLRRSIPPHCTETIVVIKAWNRCSPTQPVKMLR
jgi:hypothetical protein